MSSTPHLVFQRQENCGSTEKPVMPPPPPEATSLFPGSAGPAPGPVRLVVLGPASGGPEAPATVILTPLPLPPVPAGPRPGVSAQHRRAGLHAALRALQRRVWRLQRRHERHQGRLRALEQLAQQLCAESLPARARQGLLRAVSAPPGPCLNIRTFHPRFQISGLKKSIWYVKQLLIGAE